MAQFYAQRDPRQDIYGDIGHLLGAGLGGLGQYAAQEFQKPAKIKELEDSGLFTPEESRLYANMPPQQLSQIVQQKMKLKQQQQSDAAIANIFGGGQQPQQPDLFSLPGGDIQQRLGAGLGGPQQAPQPQQGMSPEHEQEIVQRTKGMTPEQIDQVLQSSQIPMNTKKQIYDILDKQRANEFKERSHQENKQLKERGQELQQEAPQRAQMVKEVAELEKAGRSAKNLIAGFKNLKVAARNPELRTGLWKQALDKFNLGEFGQSPISFVVDKMIQDINFASASSTTTPGKMTSSLLKNIARANPSVFSEPEGIEAMADLKIYGSKIQEAVQKEIDTIREKSTRGLLPLDTISKAYKAAAPRIEKLHEKELKVVERLNKIPKP